MHILRKGYKLYDIQDVDGKSAVCVRGADTGHTTIGPFQWCPYHNGMLPKLIGFKNGFTFAFVPGKRSRKYRNATPRACAWDTLMRASYGGLVRMHFMHFVPVIPADTRSGLLRDILDRCHTAYLTNQQNASVASIISSLRLRSPHCLHPSVADSRPGESVNIRETNKLQMS